MHKIDSGAEMSTPFYKEVQPTLLYSHVKKGEAAEDCERRKVIKDFCFPSGVEMRAIRSVADLRRALNPSDLQQSFFAFTLNSSNEMSLQD